MECTKKMFLMLFLGVASVLHVGVESGSAEEQSMHNFSLQDELALLGNPLMTDMKELKEYLVASNDDADEEDEEKEGALLHHEEEIEEEAEVA